MARPQKSTLAKKLDAIGGDDPICDHEIYDAFFNASTSATALLRSFALCFDDVVPGSTLELRDDKGRVRVRIQSESPDDEAGICVMNTEGKFVDVANLDDLRLIFREYTAEVAGITRFGTLWQNEIFGEHGCIFDEEEE
jgi:hypothetical protein